MADLEAQYMDATYEGREFDLYSLCVVRRNSRSWQRAELAEVQLAIHS